AKPRSPCRSLATTGTAAKRLLARTTDEAGGSAKRWQRLPSRKPLQGRLVPNEPQVAERVDEPALPVSAPCRLRIADLVDAAVGASCQGTLDESVRVVGEHLDPDGPGACYGGGIPAVVLGFAHENRGAGDAQPGDAADVPQFRRAKGALVPVNSSR